MRHLLYATEGHFVKLIEVLPEEEGLEFLAQRLRMDLTQLLTLQRHNKAMETVVIVERSDVHSNNIPGASTGPFLVAPVFGRRKSHLLRAEVLRVQYTPFWQPGSAPHIASHTMMLVVDKPEADLPMLLDREDFQERLFWGRQRGLALIFAAEAGAYDERMCLDADPEPRSGQPCTAPKMDLKVPNDGEEAGAHAHTGHTAHERDLLSAQHGTDGIPPCSDSGCQFTAGNGVYLEKLVIDEDATSIEGPPTPDNEESGRVSMPATKRQRVATTSPSALAASFARVLYLM